jgi:ATP-dependent RNA circularization protein (DNA/RNA ligase family)
LKYPKIQTLWKRDKNKNFTILEGDFSEDEFASIDMWEVTEKIDGTNIRIFWDGETVSFGGRTDDSQIPTFLLDVLQKTFTVDKFKEVFPDSDNVVMFGEGYGNKIQSVGKKYRKDNGLILFDVVVEGWWLERFSVNDIAHNFGIKSVPVIGIMNKEDIINFVKSKPKSKVSEEELTIEGIVARSHPLMLFRHGFPIMFKLKVSDYEKLQMSERK